MNTETNEHKKEEISTIHGYALLLSSTAEDSATKPQLLGQEINFKNLSSDEIRIIENGIILLLESSGYTLDTNLKSNQPIQKNFIIK